jgi:SAM-dependent methyltransferase
MKIAGHQHALWNGTGGQAWVESQDLLDQVLRPFDELLVGALAAEAPDRVLDVGSGTGATTVAVARRLTQGRVTGVDISEPMLRAARARAERENVMATFLLGDAQTFAFDPASFDAVVSRFGVMFFDDPVSAFTHLRRATRAGGALRFVAWRSAEENSFMTAAEQSAAPLLPDMPVWQPDAPGRYAFADGARVRRILADGGWSEIDVRPIDVPCAMPLGDLTRFTTRLGPVGRVFHEVSAPVQAEVVARIRRAAAPYVHGEEIHFTSACWLVGARA